MLNDAQIKDMTDRFLAWKLPENFCPDAGITFKREFNEGTAHQMNHEPSGTNLFGADQAEAMIRHMLDALSPSKQPAPVAWQRRMRNTAAPEGHPHADWSSWKECDQRQRVECQESGGLIAGFPELRTEVRPLYTQPSKQIGAHCQLCGGDIEGWTCQTCEAEFEEVAGLLALKSEAGGGGECLTEADRKWLVGYLDGIKDIGHCGEGTVEWRGRMNHNDRIRRILAALSTTEVGK